MISSFLVELLEFLVYIGGFFWKHDLIVDDFYF
jgi:hypothetical protein